MGKNNVIFKNILHYVHVDINGKVTSSDDTLFKLPVGSNISDFHPLFLTEIPQALKESTKTIVYPGLYIEYQNKKFYCDISIKHDSSFIAIMFFNYSNSYKKKQQETQVKNETRLFKPQNNEKQS